MVGVVGAGYVAYAAAADAEPAYRTAVAAVGDVEQTMALTGSLQPADSADLELGTSGNVAAVAVEEGDRVKAGQVLLRLDRTALRATVRQANAQLTAARARLESDRDAQAAAVAEPAATPDPTPTPAPTPTPTPEPEPEPDPVLAEQQQAVIEAQSVASAALADARTALDAQVVACADPAAEECAAALAAVQAAQEAVAIAQDALQAALDALTKTLAAAAQPQPSQEPEPTQEAEAPVQQQPVQESTVPTVTITAADLARDQAEIDQARADLVAAQQALRAATVRAPHAGRIAGLAVAVGDRAATGDVVAPGHLSEALQRRGRRQQIRRSGSSRTVSARRSPRPARPIRWPGG